MTTNPITQARADCGEIWQRWLDQPENARPDPRNRRASQEWHERWQASDERAECERITTEAMWRAHEAATPFLEAPVYRGREKATTLP